MAHGAVGALLFPDPQSPRHGPNDTYPNTPWTSGAAVFERPMAQNMGDPLTPEIPSIDGMYRRPRNKTNFAEIPSQPISYNDALYLLSLLKGMSCMSSLSCSTLVVVLVVVCSTLVVVVFVSVAIAVMLVSFSSVVVFVVLLAAIFSYQPSVKTENKFFSYIANMSKLFSIFVLCFLNARDDGDYILVSVVTLPRDVDTLELCDILSIPIPSCMHDKTISGEIAKCSWLTGI